MTATQEQVAQVTARRTRRRRELGQGQNRGGAVVAILAWALGLLFFTPVAWMFLTSFHTEGDAATNPPSFFAPLTLANYSELFQRGLTAPLINSATAAITSTILVLVLSIPAAFALSVRPVRKWTDVMFFFLSTKFLPAIAALLPIYLIVKQIGMLDNIWTLVILYTAMNLPIAVWMMQSFLAEVPVEVIEAAQVDGANLVTILVRIIGPIIVPGIAATSLICFIFSWNEFMFAVNLTAVRAGTAPVFLVGFITNEGLFLAKLCAAAVVVSLPVLIAGFAAQDKLVRGMSLGAVK
jgi:polyol transport system permease protein